MRNPYLAATFAELRATNVNYVVVQGRGYVQLWWGLIGRCPRMVLPASKLTSWSVDVVREDARRLLGQAPQGEEIETEGETQ
jgi:hypothetical protein